MAGECRSCYDCHSLRRFFLQPALFTDSADAARTPPGAAFLDFNSISGPKVRRVWHLVFFYPIGILKPSRHDNNEPPSISEFRQPGSHLTVDCGPRIVDSETLCGLCGLWVSFQVCLRTPRAVAVCQWRCHLVARRFNQNPQKPQ